MSRPYLRLTTLGKRDTIRLTRYHGDRTVVDYPSVAVSRIGVGLTIRTIFLHPLAGTTAAMKECADGRLYCDYAGSTR